MIYLGKFVKNLKRMALMLEQQYLKRQNFAQGGTIKYKYD